MITIRLDSYDCQHITAIRSFCANEVRRNPNLNGAKIRVKSGRYTCVDGADELVGAQLLASVRGLIEDVYANRTNRP